MLTASKRVAFLGVGSALMFVFLAIETFAFSAFFGSFTPAILSIPLAIAFSLFLGKKTMFVGGTMFGCCSFFLAICIANPVFINPLVSILPRIFIGIVAYLVFALTTKLCKNSEKPFVKNTLPCAIAGIFGTIINTVLTIIMMWLFNAAALSAVFTTILSFNFVAEVVGSCILVPIYVHAMNKFTI